ncbi:hypothetical protein GBF38_007556 [Nibea albiflora]|uniref:Uncharacterized protein n=1 Tax=Nibea albiflora TaxID=240163 RepID=A0ACB7EMA3_NIBAL|nr:hypothetical protein GBF38_007556 [Nibea albiflora]
MQRPRNPRGDQRSDEEQTTVRGCSCETSCQLNQELEETKAQLKRQKSLKEMFINKEKETRPPQRLPTRSEDTTKRKKKKLLQVDYEELQVAHIINEEKFTSDLQAEKNNNKLLQQELERLRISYKSAQCKKKYEELQEAHEQSQGKFSAELGAEKKKNKMIQQEMDKLCISHTESTQKYETEVIAVKQQADNLQSELDNESRLTQSQCPRASIRSRT